MFLSKRYVRDISSHRRLVREVANNTATAPTLVNHLHQFNSTDSRTVSESAESNAGHRIKRQSPGREQLCQTTYQYITPQAALNSQGKLYNCSRIWIQIGSIKNWCDLMMNVLLKIWNLKGTGCISWIKLMPRDNWYELKLARKLKCYLSKNFQCLKVHIFSI